jgi:hypothetical protein
VTTGKRTRYRVAGPWATYGEPTREKEQAVWFYVVVAVVVVLGAFWVSRTNLYRQHRRGLSKDPSQAGTRTEGKHFPTGGTFTRPEKRD